MGKPEGNRPLRVLGMDGKIILKCFLKSGNGVDRVVSGVE